MVFVNSVNIMVSSAVKLVLDKVTEYALKLADTAFERLKSEIFGSGRAVRSTDSAIYNRLNKTFR
jgi:hypothetical protein